MIERLTVDDVDGVNSLMRDPDIYPHVTDDSCPRPEDFDASDMLKSDDIYALGWRDNGSIPGLLILYALNGITYQGHICMSKECRGREAVENSLKAKDWMFENTNCRKIVAFVPDHRKVVKVIVKAIGFEREGKLKNSFLKDGTLIDEVIYGIEKGGGE